MAWARSRRERWAWLALAALALAIFATVPVARTLQRVIREQAGEGAFLALVGAGIAGATLAGARALLRRRLPAGTLAVLAAAALAYGAGAWALRRQPVEALHLLEYAALGVLAFRALSFRTGDLSVYPAAAGVCALVGLLDEGLQWLAPDRVWDLRDVGFDVASAAAIQLPIAFGWRPRSIAPRFAPAGLARLARIALAAVLLLGVSLLATPARTGWLGHHVPGLAFLTTHPDAMVEYGHRIEAPDIGVFRSRFAPAELQRIDAERGAEVGALLRRYAGEAGYRRFLAEVPPARDAFAHEARVHLFRRDRYLETAGWHPEDGAWQRRDLTVAWREHLLLSRYFPHTLRHAGATLSPERERELARRQLADTPYESRVSEGLVTRVNEAQVAGALALAVVALLGAERAAQRAARRADAGDPTPAAGPG